MQVFTTTVSARTADEAIAKLGKYAEKAGVEATGRVAVRSERHLLWNVETVLHGDRNHAWVILTSYGMDPSDDLGSHWQTVPGVGVFPN